MDLKTYADNMWNTASKEKFYWVGLENAIRDIYKLSISDADKLSLINEAVGAYTGRGQATQSTIYQHLSVTLANKVKA